MGNEHPSFFITNNILNNINIKLHMYKWKMKLMKENVINVL